MNYKGYTTARLSKPTRSYFNMSHEVKTTGNMGELIPILIDETLPNDTYNFSSEIFLRMAPMIAPIFHHVKVYVHYFFVPNRILWAGWEDFITKGRLGTSTPVPPRIALSAFFSNAEDKKIVNNIGYLGNYLGLPAGFMDRDGATGASWASRYINVLPFCAYDKIWQDYYRDRNYVADDFAIQYPLASSTGNITTLTTQWRRSLTIKRRSWKADYFTSALPWTQRGAQVLMPVEGIGSVTYLSDSLIRNSGGSGPLLGDKMIGTSNADPTGTAKGKGSVTDAGSNVQIQNIDQVSFTNTSVTINDLRTAVRLQEWAERQAIGGSRYNETILSHFATNVGDYRVNRAEFLGGGLVQVKINDVMTTAYSQDSDENVVPPANMSGQGTAYGQSNKFTYHCKEHGFVVGIMSILPNATYQDGMPRMFAGRQSFLDYPWPTFAHLGEQPVRNYEIYTNAVTWPAAGNNPEGTIFGHQSRYADWKDKHSRVSGYMATDLDFWHLGRKFSSLPVLGQTFVEFDPALQDRIFAVSGVHPLWFYIYNKGGVKRSLPYYGQPML